MRIFFLMLFSTPVWAGLVASGTVSHGGNESKIKQYFDGADVRLDFPSSPTATTQDTSLMYRGGSGTINVVENARKTYLEMSEKDLERLMMLLSAFPNAKKPAAPIDPKDIKYVKKGEETVGKWKCTRYEMQLKGKPNGTICVVPPAQVGATQADFKGFEGLSRTFAKLGPVAPQQAAFLTSGIDQAMKLGFLVEATSFDDKGQVNSRYAIDSIAKEKLASNTFTAPSGYQRNDFGTLIQGFMKKR